MSRFLPTTLTVLSLTAFSGLVHAQAAGAMGGKADSNGDGAISAVEYDQVALKRFKRMDANRDGVIDATELAAAKQKIEDRRAKRLEASLKTGKGGEAKGAKLIAAMDLNQDGSITEAEAMAASRTRFAKLDKNHDGRLDAGEQKPGGKGGLK